MLLNQHLRVRPATSAHRRGPDDGNQPQQDRQAQEHTKVLGFQFRQETYSVHSLTLAVALAQFLAAQIGRLT